MRPAVLSVLVLLAFAPAAHAAWTEPARVGAPLERFDEPAPSVAVNADGRSVVTWLEGGGGRPLRFDASVGDGRGRFAPSQVLARTAVLRPAVAIDADGRALVTWTDRFALWTAVRSPAARTFTVRRAASLPRWKGDDDLRAVPDPRGGFAVALQRSVPQGTGDRTTVSVLRLSRSGRLVGRLMLGPGRLAGFAVGAGGAQAVLWSLPRTADRTAQLAVSRRPAGAAAFAAPQPLGAGLFYPTLVGGRDDRLDVVVQRLKRSCGDSVCGAPARLTGSFADPLGPLMTISEEGRGEARYVTATRLGDTVLPAWVNQAGGDLFIGQGRVVVSLPGRARPTPLTSTIESVEPRLATLSRDRALVLTSNQRHQWRAFLATARGTVTEIAAPAGASPGIVFTGALDRSVASSGPYVVVAYPAAERMRVALGTFP